MPITPTNSYAQQAGNLDRWSGYGFWNAKNPRQQAKALEKESRYGPWPEIGRNYAGAIRAWQTGEGGGIQGALPGTQIYTPEWQEKYAQAEYNPLLHEMARRDIVRAGSRMGGAYGAEPELLAFASPALKEAQWRDVMDTKRKANLMATEGNYANAVNALTTMGGEREREFGMRNAIANMRAGGDMMTQQTMMQQDAAQSAIRAQNRAALTGALTQAGSGAISGAITGGMMFGPWGALGGGILGATGGFAGGMGGGY